MTAASQGGGAGGVEPVTGAEVLGQLGCGCERLGIEASGRGVVLLDQTEFRQVRQSAAAGLSFPWTTAGRRPSRARRRWQRCSWRSRFARNSSPLGDQVEAPPDLGLGLGELPPGEQRLAQGPMDQVEFRFEPDGLAVVVDGFLQSGLVLRGNAERVPGRGPLGVTVVGLPVISDRLVQGVTTELG